MKRDGFIFYRSFFEAAMDLNDDARLKYFDRLTRYGIDGLDESVEGIAETMFKLTKPQLDANNKRFNDGKNGGRPQKNNTIPQDKKDDKPVVIKKKNHRLSKQITTGVKNNKPKEKENVKEKEKKKVNKTLTSVKEAKAFGKPDVNKCLEIIKEFNGGILDGKIKENRSYANMLVNKINKTEFVSDGRYTREHYLTHLLSIVSKSKYDVRKISGPKNIYYNLAGLQAVAKTMATETAQEQEKEDSTFNPLY